MTTGNSAGFLAEMAVAPEATKGTSPAIATAQRDYFDSDPGINGVQNVTRLGHIQKRHNITHILSSYHVEGSIPLVVTPEGTLGHYLVCALGADTEAQQGGTTAYTHTFTNSDDPETFSMWYLRGGNQEVVIPYCVVNTLNITQSVDDALRATIGFIGQKETISTDDIDTAVAYDTNTPFHNMHLSVTGPVNAATVHNSSIDINNNYDVSRGKVHGSRFYTSMVPGQRDVSGSFDLWFDDDGDYQNFWGSTSDTTPDVLGEYTPVSLVFKWDLGDNFDGTYDRYLEITVPEAVYETTTVSIGERIVQTVNWHANYDTGDSYEIQVVLQNARSTAY